eukprot:scaffold1736_cov127-Cylindrotheca_fusiformis.AAC.36
MASSFETWITAKFFSTLLLLSALLGSAFTTNRYKTRSGFRGSGTFLNGILEWRRESELPANDICLLPFPTVEALVPGQSTTIILKEGRFFDLVDDAIENHCSIIGMVLMGDDGIILDGMPLCEIVNMEIFPGFRGKVTAEITLESVGRARIIELTQLKPTMIGKCVEIVDDPPSKSGDYLNTSRDLARRLEETLKAMPDSCYYDSYSAAHSLALRVLADDETNIGEAEELAAASWAIIACLQPERRSSVAPKAVATTDLLERFQLGAKAILEEQIRLSQSEPPFSGGGLFLDGLESDTSIFE